MSDFDFDETLDAPPPRAAVRSPSKSPVKRRGQRSRQTTARGSSPGLFSTPPSIDSSGDLANNNTAGQQSSRSSSPRSASTAAIRRRPKGVRKWGDHTRESDKIETLPFPETPSSKGRTSKRSRRGRIVEDEGNDDDERPLAARARGGERNKSRRRRTAATEGDGAADIDLSGQDDDDEDDDQVLTKRPRRQRAAASKGKTTTREANDELVGSNTGKRVVEDKRAATKNRSRRSHQKGHDAAVIEDRGKSKRSSIASRGRKRGGDESGGEDSDDGHDDGGKNNKGKAPTSKNVDIEEDDENVNEDEVATADESGEVELDAPSSDDDVSRGPTYSRAQKTSSPTRRTRSSRRTHDAGDNADVTTRKSKSAGRRRDKIISTADNEPTSSDSNKGKERGRASSTPRGRGRGRGRGSGRGRGRQSPRQAGRSASKRSDVGPSSASEVSGRDGGVDEASDDSHGDLDGEIDGLNCADRYFFAQSGAPPPTSGRTLADVKIIEGDAANEEASDDEGDIAMGGDQQAGRKLGQVEGPLSGVIANTAKNRFDSWANALEAGLNILVYGYGSKRAVLNAFAESRLNDGAVVIVNGFHGSLTIREVMCGLAEACSGFKPTYRDATTSAAFISRCLNGETGAHGEQDANAAVDEHNHSGTYTAGAALAAIARESQGSDDEGGTDGANDDARSDTSREGLRNVTRSGAQPEDEGDAEEDEALPSLLRQLSASDGFVVQDAKGERQARILARERQDGGTSAFVRKRAYLIVHSIDQGSLQTAAWCDALSLLAEVNGLGLIASIDHVSAPAAWNPLHNIRFSWMWEEVHTFAPYEKEQKQVALNITSSRMSASVASTKTLLQHVTDRARQLFAVIVSWEMNEAKDTKGIRFQELYERSRKKMIVSSEQGLRDHLIEFCDHEIVALTGNRIRMLLSKSALKQLSEEGI